MFILSALVLWIPGYSLPNTPGGPGLRFRMLGNALQANELPFFHLDTFRFVTVDNLAAVYAH